ncbi:hypothetical protein ACIQYG_02830 [Peribacillus sp. NPDC096622]|uniref:hypothetical protein n=1 Tax=Peribacillus sp. NPDC096622 TaxID=3364396 RepID=UPI00382EB0CD
MEHIAFIITLGLLCCNKKTVEIYASAVIGLTVARGSSLYRDMGIYLSYTSGTL